MRSWDGFPVDAVYVVSSDMVDKMVMIMSSNRAAESQASPVSNPSDHDVQCISASSYHHRLRDQQNI